MSEVGEWGFAKSYQKCTMHGSAQCWNGGFFAIKFEPMSEVGEWGFAKS
jgi:hypothetical protein